MTNFSKIAATSEAAGFQYYDEQDFSFTIPGQFLQHVHDPGSVYSHYTQQFQLPKNRFNQSLTPQILTNVLMNVNVSDAAGRYGVANSGRFANIVLGTAFDPVSGINAAIQYSYSVNISTSGSFLTFTVDVGNGSAVWDVTPPTIVISGKVFFYLAPF